MARNDIAGNRSWHRHLPLLLLIVATLAVFALGWHRQLTLVNVAKNHDALTAFIDRNLGAALTVYVGLYVLVVSLSIPVGLVMTVSGGLLFGWKLGAPAALLGATIGATVVFLVARSSLGVSLAARAGPMLAWLQDGFRANAFSYLLFLRLVPAFPFAAVNLAAALLGMRLSTYVAATALGIVPATFAYSIAGSGLASIVEAQSAVFKQCVASSPSPDGSDCHLSLHASDLITRELVVALAALSLIALIPAARNFWSKRNAAGKGRSRPVDRQAGG